MYAAKVQDKRLNFAVSGKLWMRSLVMRDEETGTLWSHLLGLGMEGPLKDTQLETLPSDLTDWKTWKRLHPDTTVLAMKRTARDFQTKFYRNRGLDKFVIAMAGDGAARAWSFEQLDKSPVVNDKFADQPVLLLFDRDAIACATFSRELDGRTLHFQHNDAGTLVDRETSSTWDAGTGRATAGPLKGKTLKRLVAIPSFRSAWQRFHPDSTWFGN